MNNNRLEEKRNGGKKKELLYYIKNQAIRVECITSCRCDFAARLSPDFRSLNKKESRY